jgi:hypothetical protein
VLALLAIVLVYCAGRTLDAVWPAKALAIPGEITLHEEGRPRSDFWTTVESVHNQMDADRKRIETFERDQALQIDPKRTLEQDLSIGQIEKLIAERRQRALDLATTNYNATAKTDADKLAYEGQVQAAYRSAGRTHEALQGTAPRGIFATFLQYEIKQVDNIAKGVFNWDWTGPDGVLPSLQRFVFTAPGWALGKHPVHAILMTLAGLFVWSVFGGAIARIAAVHVARDEKISVRQALRFSISKLMSFFTAPLMPLILIALIALLLAAVGWLSEIRYLGGLVSIVVGVLFVVIIGIGVLVACAVVGTVCGAGLMYPTIAVEGSDAFDAVSRSFSYVFARPWKIAIYTFLGIIYAALTYVFLRFMVFLTLSLMHTFLTLWTHDVAPDGTTSLANAWQGPAGLFDLHQPIDSFNLTLAESATAWAITFWAYLFVALLGAYLLSFFVSANTIAYYLLRYDVDAAEIDDVYLEPTEEDFEDAPIDTPVTQTVAVEPVNADPLPKTESVAKVPESPSTPSAGNTDAPTPPPAGA